MSELDKIKQQLERITSEIASAKAATDHSFGVADEKMHVMAGLGLDGVAEQVRIAGECLSSASSELAVAHTSVETASSAMQGVLDGTRLSDTVDALTKIDEALSACGTTITAASSNAGMALTTAQDTEVEAVMNTAMTAIDAIGQAAQANDTTLNTAAEYCNRIEVQTGKQQGAVPRRCRPLLRNLVPQIAPRLIKKTTKRRQVLAQQRSLNLTSSLTCSVKWTPDATTRNDLHRCVPSFGGLESMTPPAVAPC